MSWAPRPSIKRSVSLGFGALALCLGCASSSDSGGTGGAGGTSPAAGGTGSGNAGASPAGAGAGHAGSPGSCDVGECFVANTCLDHCGGSVVYSGCCECVSPAVNRNSCTADH